jgi:hypothetical protein
VWRKGKPHPDAVIADIARGAKFTVVEGDRHSPRFVPWRARDAALNGVSRSAVGPPAVDRASQVRQDPPNEPAVRESLSEV